MTGLKDLNIIHSHDLKVTANMTGIQQASSKHPCPYCHWIANYGKSSSKPAKPAELRTFGSNRRNYEKWMEKGGNKKNAKKHFNCTEVPLVSYDDGDLIMDKFPPPELHILTGIFNHMYDAMLANDELHDYVEKWSDKLGCTRRFCPGHAFVGNHCRKLLRNVDELLKTNPPRSVHKE